MRRAIRRYAKAGDASDCGHERKGGKFTEDNTCAGEGYSLYSPNIEEGTAFGYAYKMLSSSNQRVAREQADEVDQLMGLESKNYDALGDWSDGAENSVVSRHSGVKSYEHVAEAAALKGLKWNQKAVIPFAVEEDGPDVMYELDVADQDLQAIRRRLDEAGIVFRSIIPLKGSTKVVIFDKGNELSDKVTNFGGNYEEGQISGRAFRGRGEFLGADTRTEARRVYIDAIHQARAARKEAARIRPGRYRRVDRPGVDHRRGEETKRRVVQRFIRQFARAGDADDCGHQRHGGLFTPKNTCAAGDGGEDEGTSEGGSGASPLGNRGPGVAQSQLGDESDQRLVDVMKKLIDAKADADSRKSSLPTPTVMSPEPFEPDEPIRWRIANLPHSKEMMNTILNEAPPYIDQHKKKGAELFKYNEILTDNLRRNENAMMAGTLSEESEDYKAQTKLMATIDRLKDEIDSIKEKISSIVDDAIDARGTDVKLRSIDGITPFSNAWDEGEIGRRRAEAYSWLQTKLSGSGLIRTRWNASRNLDRPSAETDSSTPSINVDYDFSKTSTYIHEMGHVLEKSVAGIMDAAKEFLEYRTQHTPDRPMAELIPGMGYKENEIGNDDDFGKLGKTVGAYIGKKYPEGHESTEIVSMGLQLLYQDPVRFIEADPEYATFVMGLLDGRLRGGRGAGF